MFNTGLVLSSCAYRYEIFERNRLDRGFEPKLILEALAELGHERRPTQRYEKVRDQVDKETIRLYIFRPVLRRHGALRGEDLQHCHHVWVRL